MTFHSEEKLMRIAEVTEWLNVSKSTIYKWVKAIQELQALTPARELSK